ncbi:hypothetical protein [Thomasclavelia cocleata]|uniref:hypothetical protein n=1 Tax=Thomasclavelia cocleata TaxID=69824 RepID=UPI00255B074C|nr:hypothetical protein [Thomasclavelia cocleata]
MKKILLIILLCLSVSGCTKDIETQISEVVKKNIESIPNYHIKQISYFKADTIIADDVEYNNVYIIKVSSIDNSDYDINLISSIITLGSTLFNELLIPEYIERGYLILNENTNIITSSNYILDSDNSLEYVYKMNIYVNKKEVNDKMYTKIINK